MAAASPSDTVFVFKGTYTEMVTVGSALGGLSLVGQDSSKTIIDAAGLANGILDQASFVTISGFTIRNALHEGILVQGAAAACGDGSCAPSGPQITNVTISGNLIHDNDKALDVSTLTCPAVGPVPPPPAFEAFDCGEGVHLDGVAHSTVNDNVIVHNSGGVLLTDETNSNHDNIVSSNDVEDNAFDCGITLPSHPVNGNPANIGIAAFGVFNDTVAGNLSRHNGAAGTGVFAPTPGTASYQHLIIDNRLIDNVNPGVIFHEHAPGQNLSGTSVIGNFIAGNGAEPDPGEPPETDGPVDPTGIEIYADLHAAPIAGLKLVGNTIRHETNDIWIGAPAWSNCAASPAPCWVVSAQLNDFEPHSVGINNTADAADVLVDGTLNFWGCGKGPGAPGCASALGNVSDVPFLTAPVPH